MLLQIVAVGILFTKTLAVIDHLQSKR